MKNENIITTVFQKFDHLIFLKLFFLFRHGPRSNSHRPLSSVPTEECPRFLSLPYFRDLIDGPTCQHLKERPQV